LQLRREAFFATLRPMDKSSLAYSPVAGKKQPFSFRARIIICIACQAAALFGRAVDTRELREWENPRLTGLSNQTPHATMIICPDAAVARSIGFTANSERVKSSFYRSLNGDWKYHYSSNQLARVPDFWKTDFNDHAWDTIPVPSNVELSGYGIPIYVNYNFPWRKPWTPPFVPGDDPNNTVNAYRRNFEVPSAWAGRRVLLTFDGVNSFFDLWINGQKVGMGKDSRTPVEFDITKFLKPGSEAPGCACVHFKICDNNQTNGDPDRKMETQKLHGPGILPHAFNPSIAECPAREAFLSVLKPDRAPIAMSIRHSFLVAEQVWVTS